MADSKAKAQRRSVAGAFFGSTSKQNRPGTWSGSLDPEVKKNWQEFQKQQSTDQQFVQDQYNQTPIKKIQIQRENTERALRQQYQQTQMGQAADKQLNRTAARARLTSMKMRQEGKTKRATVAKHAAARVKVTAANAWINSWVMFWYLAFQLPMAVISAAGLGMAYAVYQAIVAVPGGKYLLPSFEVGDQTYEGGEGTLIGAILQWAAKMFGINYDPILLFATPFLLVFAFGLLQLILCWFVYSLLGIKSLSGKSGGVKFALFVIAAVGIVIPILNLFPLILFWTGAVWLKPR